MNTIGHSMYFGVPNVKSIWSILRGDDNFTARNTSTFIKVKQGKNGSIYVTTCHNYVATGL